ncbi:MAG: serine hydrolase domain-containing protein [Flavobacteriaceae bacterium]
MRKIWGLLCSLIISQAIAQEYNASQMDSLLYLLDINDKFMGSVIVVHDGEILYEKAIGHAEMARQTKATTKTKYRVGSITKMFTATLVLMAQEEGKLTLDQQLADFYPQVKNAQKISLKQLLNHRSGIFNFTNSPTYLKWNTKGKTKTELLKTIVSGGSVFDPGSKTEYSNSNFVLLTFILEDVFQKPYAELLQEKIIGPLGITNTYVGGDITIANNECHSYRYHKKWIKAEETDMSTPLGAGALVSTPSDLTTFITALFAGKLITHENLKAMLPPEKGFGFGMMTFPYSTKKGYGHGGGIDGFTSFLGYIPNDNLAFAVTSNGSNFTNNEIYVALLHSYYGKDYQMPTFDEISLSRSALKAFVGNYESEQIPIKIKVYIKKGQLYAQGTGQSEIPLTATGKSRFRFDRAGLVMSFDPNTHAMELRQGGGIFQYVRKK